MNHWIKAERQDVLQQIQIKDGKYIPKFPQEVFKILKNMLSKDQSQRPDASSIVSFISRMMAAAEKAR